MQTVASQPPAQRRLQQRIVVHVVEHGVERLTRDSRSDAGALDLPAHAQLAAPLDAGFRPCDGFRHAGVVDGALVPSVVSIAASTSSSACPFRASRWRICDSDSSRRPSIFRASM